VNAAERWQRDLEAAGELESQVVAAILDVHGDRAATAIDAIQEQRVKQYRDFTVVVGYNAEYVYEGGWCSCADAEYNLDPEDPTELCWHAIAVEIARRIDALDHHDMWYSDVRAFL